MPVVTGRFLLLGLSVLTCGAALCGAARAAEEEPDRIVATLERPAPVAVHRATLAWSAWDASSKRFRLTVRQNGSVRRLPVPGRTVAFDVDLGPGAGGHTLAVYSRCRRDASPDSDVAHPWSVRPVGEGCSIYAYDMVERRERRVTRESGTSDFAPTVWRDHLAFVRIRRGKGRTVVTSDLRGRHVHPVKVPVGAVTALDLRGGRIAVSVVRELDAFCPDALDETLRGDTETGVWLARIGGSPKRLDRGCSTGAVQSVSSASLDARGLTYVRQARRTVEEFPGWTERRVALDGSQPADRALLQYGVYLGAQRDGSRAVTLRRAGTPDGRLVYEVRQGGPD